MTTIRGKLTTRAVGEALANENARRVIANAGAEWRAYVVVLDAALDAVRSIELALMPGDGDDLSPRLEAAVEGAITDLLTLRAEAFLRERRGR